MRISDWSSDVCSSDLIDNVFDENGHLREGVIESMEFQDGTVWDLQFILSNLVVPITEGADTLYGTIVDDTIAAQGGDDLVLGLEGQDSLDGGAGNDSVVGGNGDDVTRGGVGKVGRASCRERGCREV